MARYVEAVSRPCTWGNSLLGTDTLTQGTKTRQYELVVGILTCLTYSAPYMSQFHVQDHVPSQCLYEHFSLHLQHRKFKIVCVLVTTLLGTNSSPLKNGWFYITTFPSDWGFGPIFSGGKTCPVSGRVHKKTIHPLAPLVTPRWSRWVLHSQQVRRWWELDGSLRAVLGAIPSRERIHWIHIPPGEKGKWSSIVPSQGIW